MKKIVKNFVFASAILASSIAVKEANASIYANVGAGTQGISFGASYYWKNFIGIRGTYDFIPSQITSIADSAITHIDNRIISADTKFRSYGFDLSVRPFAGKFHIDAGFRMMNYTTSISGLAKIKTNIVDINVVGDFKLKIAEGAKPYFGVGWDFNPIAGLTLGLDVGVIYTGKWNVSYERSMVTYSSANNTRNFSNSVSTNNINHYEQYLRDNNLTDADVLQYIRDNGVSKSDVSDKQILDTLKAPENQEALKYYHDAIQNGEISVDTANVAETETAVENLVATIINNSATTTSDENIVKNFFEGLNTDNINLPQSVINSVQETVPGHMSNLLNTLKENYMEDVVDGINDVLKVQNDVNSKVPSFVSFWPVVKFNIGYRFDFF